MTKYIKLVSYSTRIANIIILHSIRRDVAFVCSISPFPSIISSFPSPLLAIAIADFQPHIPTTPRLKQEPECSKIQRRLSKFEICSIEDEVFPSLSICSLFNPSPFYRDLELHLTSHQDVQMFQIPNPNSTAPSTIFIVQML